MHTVNAMMFEGRLNALMTEIDGEAPPQLSPFGSTNRRASVASPNDLICTHDLYGRILSANPAACEALGLAEATLMTMTISDLLPPSAMPGFAPYMQRIRGYGFAVGIIHVVTREGGRRTWEYGTTLDTDENFEPIVRSVLRDVTEREEALQAVRRSEEHFRSIIENASDLIAIVELDGTFRYESPSVDRVLGYSSQKLNRTPALDLVHPEDLDRAREFLTRQATDPALVQSLEVRVRHDDGTWRSLEVLATNLIKKGSVSAIVLNARDTTERKMLEAQLLQANRLGGLGRLAANVAHEFNNVLMGMQPFAELMQRPDASPQMIAKGAGHIANSIKRGKRIVLDILRFAQPHVPVTTTIDLGEWWETFGPEAESVVGNIISIETAIPHRGLFVAADLGQLSQVLSNLINNARDAMPRGGTLVVSANELEPGARFPFGSVPYPERFVQISVRDTGHGMPREVLDRVFEPLFTTRQSGGTGLGLAIAHQVLTQHQGYIFVESTPGQGSTFHLFLPKGTAVTPVQAVVAGSSANLTATRVLIVDDEKPIVEGIAALLEQDGIEVDAVGNGSEALDAIARFRPDIVLLDFGLPDMDGSEVYARIRAIDRSLPVIFATGHGDRRVLLDELKDPLARFLQKPFEVDALLTMMAELCRVEES